MIALALPSHALALPISGGLLLRARRELEAGDAEAIGIGLLALGLAPTRDQALSRLAAGWTLAQVGGEALDVLAGAGMAPGAVLALARVASQAVQSPTLATAPAPAPAEPVAPSEPDLLPDGLTIDGIPWQRASLDGTQPGATLEQIGRRATVAEAIRAHREGKLAEWAAGRASVGLPR